MLVRLEHALNCPDLAKQMLLLPKAPHRVVASEAINLVVGYNGSAKSQTALDLTLWIAYQTRLVTRLMVTVQVVYVVDSGSDRRSHPEQYADLGLPSVDLASGLPGKVMLAPCDRPELAEALCGTWTRSSSAGTGSWADLPLRQPASYQSSVQQIQQFEKADRILWQARYLADEWRGSLETHLRFGNLVEELRTVACQAPTTALILGCSSPADPIVQALGEDLPFPILGIPANIAGR